eukprot:6214230-Pleurochrysis_carterae.AAC.4
MQPGAKVFQNANHGQPTAACTRPNPQLRARHTQGRKAAKPWNLNLRYSMTGKQLKKQAD